MRGLGRRAPRQASFVVAWLLLSATALATFTNDFSAYPENARGCLQDSAGEVACEGDSVRAMNACLCGNHGGFIWKTAQCVGRSDYADLAAVYDTMAAACDYTDTRIVVTGKQFTSEGETAHASAATTATTTTATVTSTRDTKLTTATSTVFTTTLLTAIKPVTTARSTATSAVASSQTAAQPTTTPTAADGAPNNNASDDGRDGDGDGDGDGGLTKAQRTAAIVSASVGAAVLLAVAAAVVLWCRRRRQRASSDERHPMLARGGSAPASHPSLAPAELPELSSAAPLGGGSDMRDPRPSDGPWTPSYVSSASADGPSQQPGGGLYAYAELAERSPTATARGGGYDGHGEYTPPPPPPPPAGWQNTAYW